jgi:hypothetical protein
MRLRTLLDGVLDSFHFSAEAVLSRKSHLVETESFRPSCFIGRFFNKLLSDWGISQPANRIASRLDGTGTIEK